MSILDMYKRPVVKFDATNAEHRKWYANFAHTRSWGSCPFRFVVIDEKGNMVDNLAVAMANQVTMFYLNQEFKKKKSYYKRKTNAAISAKTIPSNKQQEVPL